MAAEPLSAVEARLAEIEARAEKATERYSVLRQSFDEALRGEEQERAFKNLDAFLYDNQRALMASISTDIPYLLSLIRASSAREQALEAEMLSWRIAMQRLTPGGSEFMTPKACEEYAAMLKRETVQAKLDRAGQTKRIINLIERWSSEPAMDRARHELRAALQETK